MLQAYVDASGSGDKEVFVLAGYIAPAEVWSEFSADWERTLRMKPLLPYFKMKEMKHDVERSELLYRVIERHVSAAVSCFIPVPDLINAVRTTPWPDYITLTGALENPYYFGFKAIIDMLAQHQHMLSITEPVDFIFDNDTEKKKCLEAWDRMKLASRPDVRRLMGHTPIYRDDKAVLPLQAADLYAYWVRRWRLDGRLDGVEKLPFPWPVERDIPRMEMIFNEQDFRQEFLRAWDPSILERATMDDDAIRARLKAMEEESGG